VRGVCRTEDALTHRKCARRTLRVAGRVASGARIPPTGTGAVAWFLVPASSTVALTEAQQRAVAELVRVSPVAEDLGHRFAAAGHQLHLVGGSVRDAMLGRLGDDLDFATDARPEQVLALAAGWADAIWQTGVAFGTVGLQRRGVRLEITTYRSESYRPDSRHPEVVYGDTLVGDLGRRDFTMNAMAVTLPDWRAPTAFTDPFGGMADLAAGRLRTPGRPQDSFSDDPLRMLRTARFAAQLGFTVADDVIAAMTAMVERIAIVSVERVQGELSRLLLSTQPRIGLELLTATGLAAQVLPELPALRMEIDEHHQHKDVYAHTLSVLERAIALEPDGPDLVLRMAALLHDIGKPRTRQHEAGGGVSFHHHEVVGAKLARKRLTALHYPKAFIDDVSLLVELHLRFHGFGRGEWTDAAVRRYVRDAGDQLPRLHLLVRSDCTTRNRRRAAALAAAYDALADRIARLAAAEDLQALRPDLDGTEIMRQLDIPPGPDVGRAYRHLLALRMEQGPLGHDEAVEVLRAWAAANGVGT
jgi:poly(A) polymerase